MADVTSPAPAGNDDAQPLSIRDAADSLPDDAFGFGPDDDEAGSEPAEAPAPRAPRAPRQDTQFADEAPSEPDQDTRPRRPDGKFAPRDGGQGDEQDASQDDEGDDQAEADPNAPQDAPQDGQEPEGEPKKAKAEAAIEITIDGQRYTAEDVRRGFLRNEDYTRKTQEIARERHEVQGKVQQIQAYEQQLAGILDIAVNALRETLPPAPDKSMLDVDIVGYHKQMAAHNEAVARLQAIAGQHEQVGQRTAAQRRAAEEQQSAAMQHALQTEFARMQEKIPELRSPEGRDTFFRDAQTHGAYYGLSPQDIGAIQDHRALHVLRDAMAYRKLQATKPQTVERLKSAPPIRPQARPAAGTRQGQAKREATERFVREPSIKNALQTGVLDSIFGT